MTWDGPKPSRATRTIAVGILVAVTGGMALLAVAMRFYPGGNALDPRQSGHSFWLNFLCDLTNATAVNGQPNHPGAELARVSLVALAAALAGFWLIAPSRLSAGAPFCWAVRVFGLMSVVGLLVVPAASGWLHRVAVLTSSVPALVAGFLVVMGLARDKSWPGLTALGGVSVGVTLLDAILYARTFATEPRIVPPSVPFFQRIAVLSMVAWMAAVAFSVLRRHAARSGSTHSPPATSRDRGYSGTKR